MFMIALLYGVVAVNVMDKDEEDPLRGLENLPAYLLQFWEKDTVRIRCSGMACETCRVEKDGEVLEDAAPELFEKRPVVHRFDRKGYLEERRFPEPYCFDYSLFPNGSATQMLVEYDGRFYLFNAYMGMEKAQVFTFLEEAKNALDPATYLPKGWSEYYHKGF